ncbi:MAG: universal stress protein [Methyloversatilis sp.]|jgi:nucleotide-binding universal stress UspA family protein|nr:universal stress protein [Methyloversatilis sp.]
MKVVVAYDGSKHAHKAIDQLKLLSGPIDAVIVSVVRGPALGIRGTALDVDQAEIDDAREALDKVAAELAGRGLSVRTRLAMGEPADVVVDIAEEENAELIILGTRGLSLAKRIVMGSVSSSVLHHAPCSVFVVR